MTLDSRMFELTGRFTRSLDALDNLHAMVSTFSAQSALPQPLSIELALVAEELFVNAVRHSTGPRGDIELHLSTQDEVLTVRLIDMNVDQLDITQIAPTNLDLPIEQRRTGGMGLHIVHYFADQINYKYEHGNGIITIEKNMKAPDVSDTQ